MMKIVYKQLTRVAVLVCSIGFGSQANAQYTRSTYFMEGVGFRQQLNPAQTPDQGYFNIPVIGGIHGFIHNNSVPLFDYQKEEYADHDVDFYMKDSFMKKVKDFTVAQGTATVDVLSFGWYKKQSFWNANLSVRTDMGLGVPKDFFHFLRDTRGLNPESWANYSRQFGGEKINGTIYIEAGVGYARPINDKLTVGAKAKLLLGLANINVNINNVQVKTQLTNIDANQDWNHITYEELSKIKGEASVEADATLDATLGGYHVVYDEKGYAKEIDSESGIGIAGVGMGFDLGATYRLTDQLTLSASLLDLGFITWGKGSSYNAASQYRRTYTFGDNNNGEAEDFRSLMSSGNLIEFDLIQLKETQARGRTTALSTSLVIGGEYKLLNDKLTLGLLSTTRFTPIKTIPEITLSTAYKVNRHIGFSLGYSVIQGGGSGLGVGMKLGPVILATDYALLTNKTKALHFLFGISVPMGAKKMKEKKEGQK